MINTLSPEQFQQCVLDWFDVHGRKLLPWQQNKSPYQVWLSEIMLQQTQVGTVVPYFLRFIQRFPTLVSLAEADLDEVLSHWSGLGYYARGRNLHRCAQIIVKCHNGYFPQQLAELQGLPGIGRSTAGAILSLGFDRAAPILDGNVKRVLARLHAIAAWPGATEINKRLWALAESYTPSLRAGDYAQAMMDLGALICTPRAPKCEQCPLKEHCLAYHSQDPTHFPGSRAKKKRPTRSIQLLLLINSQQEILLEKRPPLGIWGGLWSLPECPIGKDAGKFAKKYYACATHQLRETILLTHHFTHFRLEIEATPLKVTSWSPPLMESNRFTWHPMQAVQEKGLSTPVKKLIRQLQ